VRNLEQAYRSRRKVTIERTFDASIDEVWEMWTTKEGLEAWWAPEGFRVKIRKLELKPGGEVVYDSSAVENDVIDFLKTEGLPLAHEERLRFTEIDPPHHLVQRLLIDFVPGVDAYEVETEVDLESGPMGTRMVMAFEVMHDERFTGFAVLGWESQFRNLATALSRKHGKGGL
jgi:uncharacterized protein YndB with AHSA1/START domain